MTHSRMVIGVLIGVGLGLVWSGPAEAQLGKRKLGTIKTMGKRKGMTKEEAERLTKAETITASDMRKSQSRLKKLASQKEAIIRRLIRIMENTLKLEDPDAAKYPDYLFRVAEHYNAMRMNQWQSAMALHEAIFKAEDGGNANLAKQLKVRQKLLFQRAEWWLRKSLEKYILITNNPKYKNYARMDEVIFTVGDIAKSLAEDAAKRKDSAKQQAYQQVMLVQFSRLTKEFPRSRYIPDALLAKAEYFFNNRQMVEAIEIYQRVARFQGTPLAPYAEYKIGWCYLNLKQHRQALRQFVMVAKGSVGGKNLISAARKDVVRAYTHIGRPEKAYDFFHNVSKGRPEVSKMMYLLLGTMYYAQGKNAECVQVFKDAWKSRWPRDKERCQWVTTIVDATINVGVKEHQVKAVQWLGSVTTELTKQLGTKAPQVKQCRASTENTMKMLATQWHAEGLKTKNMATLNLTRSLYETYIKTYPSSPVFYLMSYQYADLLWFFNMKNSDTTRDEWVKLANLFTRIVKLGKPSDLNQKEFIQKRNDAALAAVRCWMKANKVTDQQLTGYDNKNRSQKKCIKKVRRRCVEYENEFAKREIPQAELSMLDAFNTYLKYVPKSEYRPAIAFNTGHIYWRYNHFTEAVPLFLKVALDHQGDMPRAARTAAFRVIGMLSVQKKFKEMREYIDKFIAAKKLMEDEVFKAKMHDYKLKAMWADSDRLMAKKKWAECGAAFEDMAARFPGGSNMDTFYWNAGACYENAGMVGPAVSMRRKIVRNYPKSKHAALAMYFMAGNYHNLAFFADAAQWYEKFFETHKKHKEAAEALMWGIVLRGGLGDDRRMMRNAASFIERFQGSKKKLSAKAFWLVVKMYENNMDEDKLMINLSRYARGYGAAGDVDKHLESLSKLGEIFWRRSCKVAQTSGQCIRISYVRRKGMKKKQKVIIFLERERRMVNTAKRYFGQALRVWANGRGLLRIAKNVSAGDKAGMISTARHWAAHAKFMQAEFKFEDYLRLKLPAKLDFNPRNPAKAKKSIQRFSAWIKSKLTAGAKLINEYMAVVTGIRVMMQGKRRGDPHWSIAAVARSGMIFHNFADLLLNAPVPKFLEKSFEAKDAYKAQLENFANPLLSKAQIRYKICLKLSNDLRWFNEWSRLCELEINRLEPDKYPLANERRARPGYVATTIDKADFKLEAK